MAGGVGHRHRPALGHSHEREALEPERFDDGFQIGHPGVEGEIADLPVGKPAAAFVVPDEGVATRQVAHPVPPHRALNVVAEVGHPVGGPDQRWPFAGDRVRQPDPVGGAAERDVLTRRRHLGRRSLRGFVRRDSRDELIAAAAHRADVALRLAVVAERPTGGLDPAGQRGLSDEPPTPHGVEQLFFADEPVVVGDEVGQYVEHLRLDLDDVVAATQFVPRGVEDELAEPPDAAVSRATGGGRNGLGR